MVKLIYNPRKFVLNLKVSKWICKACKVFKQKTDKNSAILMFEWSNTSIIKENLSELKKVSKWICKACKVYKIAQYSFLIYKTHL